jgi:ArsR family transcriptional regulator, lead/cadmium/zinc/bismuth-responsive transcriptional repressor
LDDQLYEFWHTGLVHLLPDERAGHRIIDGERVCQAIAALGDPESVQARAQQFAVLADPTRLTLLTCIDVAGPISVSDLAAATGLHDATVSQALRYLRAARIVSTERDGRIVRYRLTDGPVSALLTAQPAWAQRA